MLAGRILLVHNYYRQPGGEDMVFAAEQNLVLAQGHHVIPYTDSNSRIDAMKPLTAALNTTWSNESYHALKKIIKTHRPDIAHFHNTFFMVSPSAYYACREEGVPVVQTLHNYRLLCPSATFFRDSRVCEECLGKDFALPGIYHACYRSSRSQTACVAAMIFSHRILGTWRNLVNVYIVLTNFSRLKYIKGGLPESKLMVKPNFVAADPGVGVAKGNYVLFVGRLSEEKGLQAMLEAWKGLSPSIPLRIVGNGPLRGMVLRLISEYHLEKVEYFNGRLHEDVLDLMKDARFLVFPSECYEGFPMVIAEAFTVGIPVIASRLGSMEEIVRDGETGLLFNPGDSTDLATKIKWLWNHPDESQRLGSHARKEYEEKYTPERNYRILMEIYEKAIAEGK